LLQGDRCADLEIIASLFDGIQAKSLQIYRFNGISLVLSGAEGCRVGEKRPASQWDHVGLSQKGQGLIQSFGAVVRSDHKKSPGELSLLYS
jgi:hypothetical protein